jgi:hypothetical protein
MSRKFSKEQATGAESVADGSRNRTQKTIAHQPAESKVVASSDKGSITC